MEQRQLHQADECFRSGDLDAAVRLYDEARELRTDAAYQAFIDLNIAQCLRIQGHSREALLTATSAYHRINQQAPTALTASILTAMGNALGDSAEYDEAIQCLAKAQVIFSSLRHQAGQQQVQISTSRCLLGLGDTDEARALLTRILESGPDNPEIESQVLTNLASMTWMTSPEETESLLRRNLELTMRYDNPRDKALTLINLALFKSEQDQLDEALVILQSAEVAAKAAHALELVQQSKRLQRDLLSEHN